jgi:TPP-dependent trihydroxycyclohexane-1,2-dione (THcHDO) dehydratase
VVKFLGAQYSESDGEEQKLFAGCFGIFGHGNVAGIGQALLQAELEEPDTLPYILGRNEQAMVHTAVAYARMKNWLQTYASIGSLSESLGSQRFGTQYRYRNRETGRLDGEKLPVDLASNAGSLGVQVIKSTTTGEFAEAIKAAKAADHSVVIYVETDPLIGAPDSESWWDVSVSATSTLESTQQAPKTYDEYKATQKLFL